MKVQNGRETYVEPAVLYGFNIHITVVLERKQRFKDAYVDTSKK